jgi:hypothetical protein
MNTSAHLVDVYLMYDPVHYQKETTSCHATKWNKAIEQWPKSLRLLLLIPNKIFALILLLPPLATSSKCTDYHHTYAPSLWCSYEHAFTLFN